MFLSRGTKGLANARAAAASWLPIGATGLRRILFEGSAMAHVTETIAVPPVPSPRSPRIFSICSAMLLRTLRERACLWAGQFLSHDNNVRQQSAHDECVPLATPPFCWDPLPGWRCLAVINPLLAQKLVWEGRTARSRREAAVASFPHDPKTATHGRA